MTRVLLDFRQLPPNGFGVVLMHAELEDLGAKARVRCLKWRTPEGLQGIGSDQANLEERQLI